MQVNEKAYFSGSSADALKSQEKTYTTGLRVYDLSRPEAPREIGFMPTDGLGPAPDLVRRRPLRLSLDPFRRLQRPRAGDRRHGRPDQAPCGRQILAAGHVDRRAARRRPGPRASATRCITALVAGNLLYSAWRDGGLAVIDVGDPTKPEAGVPPQLGPAVRRRHPLAAAAAGPQSAGRGGRGQFRQLQPRACATSGFSTCACRPIR